MVSEHAQPQSLHVISTRPIVDVDDDNRLQADKVKGVVLEDC